jgi:hypothetical protein
MASRLVELGEQRRVPQSLDAQIRHGRLGSDDDMDEQRQRKKER